MRDSFKTAAAKFIVPLLCGIIVAGVPASFAIGKAYAADRGDVNAVAARVKALEDERSLALAEKKASLDRAQSDHDAIVRIDERTKALAETLADMKKLREDFAAFLARQQKQGDGR